MLALPSKTRGLPQRLLRHGGCVDKHLNVAASLRNQPPRQPLEPFLHHVMIIAVLCIDGNCGLLRLLQNVQWILRRPIVLRQHNHRPRLWPQHLRRATPVRPCGQPSHLPVIPSIQKFAQAGRHIRHIPGAAHLAGRKPFSQSLSLDARGQVHSSLRFLWATNTSGEAAGRGQRPHIGFFVRKIRNRSEIQICIMRWLRKTRHLICKDRPEGRARLDLRIPILDRLASVPIHITNIVQR